MKTLGILLVIAGLVWGGVALNMNIGVDTGYLPYYGNRTVVNIGLVERRRIHLGISALLILTGSVLFGFGSVAPPRPHDPGTKICPYCAEPVMSSAVICKHCHGDIAPMKAITAADEPDLDLDLDSIFIECSWCGKESLRNSEQCEFCGAKMGTSPLEHYRQMTMDDLISMRDSNNIQNGILADAIQAAIDEKRLAQIKEKAERNIRT